MIAFLANLFGYVLNFLYEFVGNYGLAIILFSIILKIIMLPISIKQQKTLKKNEKIQQEMKQIQFKYKNDPEKMNQEVMELYKRENLSPFSGCLSSIVQIILLLAVFYLVSSPLTYMKKVDTEIIDKSKAIVLQEGEENRYQEISVIQYAKKLESQSSVSKEQTNNEENINEINQNEVQSEMVNEENQNEVISENNQNENTEETVNKDNEYIFNHLDELTLNMDFLGVDLSKVPTQDLTDLKVLIIPILYVLSSFISIKLTNSMQDKKKKQKEKNLISDGKPKEEEYDAMAEANKTMSWMMPIMSISIACIAPLGLALYWLTNNILMIAERIILNKVEEKEGAKEDA